MKHCSACGKEIEEDSKFCIYCGNKQDQGNKSINVVNTNNGNSRKMKILENKKGTIVIAGMVVLVITIFILLCGGGGISNGEAKEIIAKLRNFTVLEKEEGDYPKYIFDYNGEWQLEYLNENEFARIKDPQIFGIFSGAFMEEELGFKGEFCYDFDKNDLNMFFDVDTSEGHLSSVTYNLDKDEYTLIMDGERYELTDEFEEYLEEYNLKRILKVDVDNFVNSLEANGVTLKNVTDLTYKLVKDNTSNISERSEEEQNYDMSDFVGVTGNYISTSGGSENCITMEIYDSGNGYMNVTFKSITHNGVVSAQGKITGINTVEADWNNAHFSLEWTDAGEVTVSRTGSTGYSDIDGFTEYENFINNSYYQVG